MQELTKIASRQDTYFKLSPSSSNETSINLSNEISSLISDESGEVTFTIYKVDFVKAISALCLMPKVYKKKETEPSNPATIIASLFPTINAQFGDSETSEYTINFLKRDDGRAYFNNLKLANGFNLRAFLIEQLSSLTFIKNDDGKLSIRLETSLPEAAIEHVEVKPSFDKSPLDEPLQQIFYGAPGTGKSFKIDGMTNDANSVRATFHPDSDYASFVGAYKPTMQPMPIHAFVGTTVHKAKTADNAEAMEKKIVYKYVPQAFLKAYVAAWKDLDNPHYLIIEEINRGNCAQIFGDLFQLLDRNSQGASSYAINADEDISQFLRDDENGFAKLPEQTADAICKFVLQKDNRETVAIGADILSGKKLLLPPNLYIWATMNTSDQSLFPIDSAFKRRWNWEYIPIRFFENDSDPSLAYRSFQIGNVRYSWADFLKIINPIISELTESADKQMGFFFAKPDKKSASSLKDNDIISEKIFLNKVLFYLWTDVLKDFNVGREEFKKPDGKNLEFTDFFTEGNTYLENFVAKLGVAVIGNDEADNTANSEERSKRIYGRTLIVKFHDGSEIKGDTQFDTYIEALQKIGLDVAAEAIQKKGYSRNGAPLLSKEKYESIENSPTFSYVPCDEYFVIKGIDTMEGTLKGISKELGLDLHVYFE